MIKDELKEHIQNSIKANKSFDEINTKLINSGWAKQDIRDTYEFLAKDSKKSLSVLAIVAFIFSIILPLIGLILSIIALVKLKKNPAQRGIRFAIAGVIISSLMMLMLVFSTILGIIVLSRGREFVNEQQQGVEEATKGYVCRGALLDIRIDESKPLCYNTALNTLTLGITNLGLEEISMFGATAIDNESNTFSSQTEYKLGKYESGILNFEFEQDIGTIEYISIYPIVFDEATSSFIPCTEDNIEESSVPVCS
ncbi:DUF4190 domain-containing protein [Candidatus Woesearchaeota archaeon]|nr:DUF4190 domain-containing protein [Candidatus Woesearchaeota archaeon]